VYFVADARTGAGGVRFCSLRCTSKWNGRIRELRERGAFVEDVHPFVVFARDGWRCWICERATFRSWDWGNGWHSDAPTLDHVVPLARGGEHSYANVRTAHALCNSRKADGDPVALALVA
jgi:5-methylcytosine-specific restriction endonuclease McrA